MVWRIGIQATKLYYWASSKGAAHTSGRHEDAITRMRFTIISSLQTRAGSNPIICARCERTTCTKKDKPSYIGLLEALMMRVGQEGEGKCRESLGVVEAHLTQSC